MTLQLEGSWLPWKLKTKRILKIHRAKHNLMNHSGNLTLKIIQMLALMRKIHRCGDIYRKKKTNLFQRSGCQDLLPLFLCQTPQAPPSPIFISWTLCNSQLTSFQIPPFHFLIIFLLQLQTHPWLYLTPCAGVPSSFSLSHVHKYCPHPFLFFTSPLDIPSAFTNCGMLSISETHFQFQVSRFLLAWTALLFCTKLLTLLTPQNIYTPYSPCFTCFWSQAFSSHLLLTLLLLSHTAHLHTLPPIPWTSLT